MQQRVGLYVSAVAVAALTALTCGWCPPAQAQFSRNRNGSGSSSTFHVQFNRTWDIALSDPVKLIEIGAITDKKKNNLLMLVDGKEQTDFHRQLLLTHWDGSRFASDYSAEFQGTVADALLVGNFRTITPSPVPSSSTTLFQNPQVPAGRQQQGANGTKQKPAKTPPPERSNQVVTTEGIYSWTGQTLARLFACPVDMRLALMRDKLPDLLVSGSGDQAVAFQVNEYDFQTYKSGPPTDGVGYVRFGVGTQEYPGKEKTQISPDVRYAQTYWTNRAKWVVGLMKGTPLTTSDVPNATTGDRLVIYAPKFSSRDKSFWSTKMEDFEENWRSEPLPGRVLDIRVGDPKNDGKEGILVLTAENKDKDRHLYFYAVTTSLMGGP
ncbi:MAG TPA: hypothetical protein VKU00_04075 [Chthonomonadaceae bacterium]|nr:hypothetical protein [Chthonomonadaceae bacterium]